MSDPTIDPDGNPYEHATYPPGTLALYGKVRELLTAALSGPPIDLNTRSGKVLLQRLASRIVKAARQHEWVD